VKRVESNLEKCRYVNKVECIQKSVFFIIVILVCLCLACCNKASDNNKDKQLTNITTVASATILASANETEVTEALSNINEVDYSECFDGFEGGAVFFNSDTNVYRMYNKALCEKRTSPCSTFKIVATIMGLENGVIKSVDSTMGYDGTVFSTRTWNKDLCLKEAFQESCVWYFRKVIDQVGKSEVQKGLVKLQYGNCDISQWEGSGINSSPKLNGFWLESSLEISPKEQVKVLADIFNGKTDFSKQNIEILKEVMLTHKNEKVSIYGKTGTGKNVKTGNRDNGWFVGMAENSDERYYFAVHLTDETKEVSGVKAKEIALNIINRYYVEK
jgi:bla regulator protein BlaR1